MQGEWISSRNILEDKLRSFISVDDLDKLIDLKSSIENRIKQETKKKRLELVDDCDHMFKPTGYSNITEDHEMEEVYECGVCNMQVIGNDNVGYKLYRL